MEWPDALAHCDTLDWGGYTDWYLPDIHELMSTASFLPRSETPFYDAEAFPGLKAPLWSSASHADFSTRDAWFLSGTEVRTDPKYYSKNVQCVRRDAVTRPSRRYCRSAGQEPVVEDRLINRMWVGCALGFNGPDCEGGGLHSGYTFDEAVDYCDDLNWHGYTDWRLPTIRELASLLDYRREDQRDKEAFAGAYPVLYIWSSTPYDQGSGIWTVFFDAGWLRSVSPNSIEKVRCVREPG
jgi:hypothetical protein